MPLQVPPKQGACKANEYLGLRWTESNLVVEKRYEGSRTSFLIFRLLPTTDGWRNIGKVRAGNHVQNTVDDCIVCLNQILQAAVFDCSLQLHWFISRPAFMSFGSPADLDTFLSLNIDKKFKTAGGFAVGCCENVAAFLELFFLFTLDHLI